MTMLCSTYMGSDEFGLNFPNSLPKLHSAPLSPDVMCNGVPEALLGRADNGDTDK